MAACPAAGRPAVPRPPHRGPGCAAASRGWRRLSDLRPEGRRKELPAEIEPRRPVQHAAAVPSGQRQRHLIPGALARPALSVRDPASGSPRSPRWLPGWARAAALPRPADRGIAAVARQYRRLRCRLRRTGLLRCTSSRLGPRPDTAVTTQHPPGHVTVSVGRFQRADSSGPDSHDTPPGQGPQLTGISRARRPTMRRGRLAGPGRGLLGCWRGRQAAVLVGLALPVE
jgi:hypothetical protein